MKVLNSSDTNHEIIFIPRYYFDGDITMELYNEETSETLSFVLTPITIDGYVYINFTQAFDNNSNFQIKMLSGTEIVYRGKLFVTNQTDLQEYKITKDIFTL